METVNNVTSEVIGAAIEVHRELGPGLLESAYQACLACELGQRGLAFESEKTLPILYRGRSANSSVCMRLSCSRTCGSRA